jgi:hypothetical protein
MLRNIATLAAGVILGGFSIWGVTLLYESVRGYSWPHVNGPSFHPPRVPSECPQGRANGSHTGRKCGMSTSWATGT